MKPKKRLKVISLGWGIQSFTMAAMAALGELETPDLILHADTRHEKKSTYKFAEKWTPWLQDHGLKTVTVANDNEKDQIGYYDVLRGGSVVMIPAFTIGQGVKGMLKRQCTDKWKIRPMRRYLKKNLRGNWFEVWIGITLDEATRMKPSDVQYIKNRWPLIEKNFSRLDCINWLTRQELEIPPKSACFFCPYQNDGSWRNLRSENGEDWAGAVEIDQFIREMAPPHDLFLHRKGIPLDQIDLRTDREKGQLSFWDEECHGLCGV